MGGGSKTKGRSSTTGGAAGGGGGGGGARDKETRRNQQQNNNVPPQTAENKAPTAKEKASTTKTVGSKSSSAGPSSTATDKIEFPKINVTEISAKNDGKSEFRPDLMPAYVWDSKSEFHFYKLVINHRPVGVNRHFQMMTIYQKFVEQMKLDPTKFHVDELWNKLKTHYNLEKLESNLESRMEEERVGFPDGEFKLPNSFKEAMKIKEDESD